MEYIIVKAWNVDDLVKKVNTRIAEGFKPLGGVIWDKSDYIQSMFRD